MHIAHAEGLGYSPKNTCHLFNRGKTERCQYHRVGQVSIDTSGSEAVYSRSSTAHSLEAARHCVEGVPLPTALRHALRQCGSVQEELRCPLPKRYEAEK